jgi:hypothetical protein
LGASQSGGDSGLGDWLLAQHRIVVRDSRLIWVDETLGGVPLELKDVDVQVKQLFWTHRFGVRATPPIEVAAPIDIRGDLLGRSFREPWLVRPGLLRYRLCRSAPCGSGSAAVQTTGARAPPVWGRLERAATSADVALSNLHTRLADEVPELQVSSLRGRLGWRSDARAFQLWARGLTFATPDGVLLPPADISYSRTRPGANRPPAAELAFDAVELDAVVRLLDRLPLDPELRARLHELNPRGRLRTFHVRWREPFSWSGPYAVSGSFKDVAVNPSGRVPGMSHVNGEVDASERGGSHHATS